MQKLILFIVIFCIVYLFYFLFVICRKKKLEKIKTSTEVLFLKRKFNLKLENISLKLLANLIAIINAFIIGTTFVISEFFSNVIIKLMIIFVTLIILILICYEIFGKILKKKEGK